MKASTPIVPSLGLNAVRLSLLSGAVTAALGAPAMAQESMEIELDPFEHTVFVPGEDTRDVLVTGVKTATITAALATKIPTKTSVIWVDFVCFPTRIRLIIRTVSSRRGRSLCMRSQTAGAPRLKRWAGTLRTCLSLQGISTSRQMCR